VDGEEAAVRLLAHHDALQDDGRFLVIHHHPELRQSPHAGLLWPSAGAADGPENESVSARLAHFHLEGPGGLTLPLIEHPRTRVAGPPHLDMLDLRRADVVELVAQFEGLPRHVDDADRGWF